MPLLHRIGWLGYQMALAAALALSAPWQLLRRGAHYRPTLTTRLGRYPRNPPAAPAGALWIHAVSVGEALVAATLVEALPAGWPLVVTTVTPTGQARARAALADRPATTVTYLPFDLGFAVGAFFRRHAPRALVLVEGDYWPLALREAHRRALPVAVVNGRVGDRSAARLRRHSNLSKRLFFAHVARFGMQTDEDRRRLIDAGADAARVEVTGNLKFDTPEPAPRPELEAWVRRHAAGRPVLVAGSTMEGEDGLVLDAYASLGPDRAALVLAPRHPERWESVAKEVAGGGFRLVRRSAADPATDATGDVLLLDSLGELAAAYRVAQGAFVGGTLVPTGGHNPLEPARFAVPVAAGPAMHNFREIAAMFDRDRAWCRVSDGASLAAAWDSWLRDPDAAQGLGERGAALVAAGSGALDRTVAMLRPMLDAAMSDAEERP